ncbi:predicted protein [Naegleria gruberi]|uniref:Predicted protein n=1 Tax=Naegleria gruberi TaxID=5762 RepID=D2V1N6_NAEGR|nr:uncharacterized protein NAEGRDRAFT_62639 [Naegleria gruberi]EFC49340.1 predicted protein [Naegleria gruberi]|eukprot:XP_002682084.1 predicted protein [Naegleria gruberi strain NEG-M]
MSTATSTEQLPKGTIRSIGGATFVYETTTENSNETVQIAIDPMLCPQGHVFDFGLFKSERLNAPSLKGENDLTNIDLWLLTHGHEDHVDRYGLEKILKGNPKSIIVAHPGVQFLLTQIFKHEDITFDGRVVHWMNPQQDLELQVKGLTISIHSVNAIHGQNEEFGNITMGNANGYIVKIKENQTKFYVTGDSVFNERNIAKDVDELTREQFDFVITNGGEASLKKTPFVGDISTNVIGNITNNSQNIIELHKKLVPKQTLIVHHGTLSHYDEILGRDSFAHVSADIIPLFPGDIHQTL